MAHSLQGANFTYGLPEPIVADHASSPGGFPLVTIGDQAALWYDTADYEGVIRAVRDLQGDIGRVSGRLPAFSANQPASKHAVIVGTIGHSAQIDALVKAGKLDVSDLSGKWERFVITTVEQPVKGIERALVIAGSDRRGTIYGVYELSEQLGVSPWYWWADVPVKNRIEAYVIPGRHLSTEPAVKYRGIFINDEDWGLYPWAKKTFDPEFKNIGPKTYAKVYELMLRLRLNYLWPAMHACTVEFGSIPENIALADQYGIIAGSSHCEPMLYNNIRWDEQKRGPWNYSLNRDVIHDTWEKEVKARKGNESIWTLGMRGIHDLGMQEPPVDMGGKLELMTKIFSDQRALLDQHVSKQWGEVVECFVPYKETLRIYDAGLKVPEDVTLVWVDDNFGYIRRLSSPEERSRRGGSGVYWHLSYYGGPHSYLWINTVSPAFMWEELHKAWENEARRIWVLNVGDIKPMEISIDYFSKLAWSPENFGLGAQAAFLRDFIARNVDEKSAAAVANLLGEFYRLGSVRKPELMNRQWAFSLPPERANELEADYRNLLAREEATYAMIPKQARDAYFEIVGFSARVQAASGLIFMLDRKARGGVEAAANDGEVGRLRGFLEEQVTHFNTRVAGGKWNFMMPGIEVTEDLTKWNSQVRWPWGEKSAPSAPPKMQLGEGRTIWRAAASADRKSVSGKAQWARIEGLGASGQALALKPADPSAVWTAGDDSAPFLEFDFSTDGKDTEALLEFLPTFRIHPGMKLRVTVSVDDLPFTELEVPGSSGAEDEVGKTRHSAVQNNYVRAKVPLRNLSPGRHVFKIGAMDPGAVIDRVCLPSSK